MRRLHDAIPVLSPAEDKWLQGELQTTGPRQFQAVYSAEGQKSVAKRFTTAQMIDLSALASGTMRPAVEMLLWATVASRYGDSDFANAVADLANRKIIEGGFLPKVPGQEAEVLNGLCNFVEARIMEDILIPYLTDAARKP